jgi:hypothetical protein|tara:strand:- start:952 stop:1545 length:594 start_codon:yes stop_codon:yes gene_type:complete
MKEVQKNKAGNRFYKIIPLSFMLIAIAIIGVMSSFATDINEQVLTEIEETSLKEGIPFEETIDSKKYSFHSNSNEKGAKSSEIMAIFKCRVKPGMLEQNKEIWNYFVKRINKNEPGWKGNCYYNSDESIVTYIEIFKDLDAFEFQEKEHLKDPSARKKCEATAALISADFYGLISTESSELLNDKSISKKFSGNFKF